MTTTRLKVTLRDVEPRVLRVFDVPADSTLDELHDLFQIGFGWPGRQPYQFATGLTVFLADPGEVREETLDEDLDPHFRYRYHPVEGWEHDVVVLGPGGAVGCVYGEGVCPPEGSGGPRQYAERLRVLGDSGAGEFRQGVVDLRVRQMAGAVPESVQLLLALIGEEVEATIYGEFPPSVSGPMHERRPRWNVPGQTGEKNALPPLTALHSVLRSAGVLVPAEPGRVCPAPRAHDPRFVVRRLRSWFTPGAFGAFVAGTAVGYLAARGATDENTLINAVLGAAERGDAVTGHDIRTALHHLRPALTGLDLAESTRSGWLPGPSARSLLPLATAMSTGSGAPQQELTTR
ncbi:plasmid pRiA4b ORF-3 family protein [Kineosporia mesophila]|uniref:plasmid pRiA4b ORF-3 family protein n=1 Tax=Kineosporia mesophila TaxID=566012 RepID=UPI001E58AD56|nr:plasmid pRiA4b ORF-3 family protein [Kineosporia mesophila]